MEVVATMAVSTERATGGTPSVAGTTEAVSVAGTTEVVSVVAGTTAVVASTVVPRLVVDLLHHGDVAPHMVGLVPVLDLVRRHLLPASATAAARMLLLRSVC